MGFELVRDLCLSLSKIVTEARTIAKDPNVDGFGHHNPQLGQEDEFVQLIQMGIPDGREGYDMPMTASTRAMRHTAVVTMRLWAMLEGEQQRVYSLEA